MEAGAEPSSSLTKSGTVQASYDVRAWQPALAAHWSLGGVHGVSYDLQTPKGGSTWAKTPCSSESQSPGLQTPAPVL